MLGAVIVTKDTLSSLISQIATQQNVEPELINAVIKVESNYDINASRYEKHLNDSSWGLMQILLKTAKWILNNDQLTIAQVVSPPINILAGTKYLAYLLKRYNGNIGDAIASYNAGSAKKTSDGSYVNQGYVNQVYGYYTVYKTTSFVMSSEGTTGLLAAGFIGAGLFLLVR